MMSHNLRKTVSLIAICTASTAIALALMQIGIFSDLTRIFEAKTFDYRMARYRGPLVAAGTALDDVLIVDVDEASLAALGQFYRWPRSYHAELVDSLSAAGAAAIGFDILFPEPDSISEAVARMYARDLAKAGRGDVGDIEDLLLAVTSDRGLGEAALRSGRVFFGVSTAPGKGGPQFLYPVNAIAEGARGFGHVQVMPDEDGIVRRLRPLLTLNSVQEPSLAVRLWMEAEGLSTDDIRTGIGGIGGEGWWIPTDASGDVLLDYAGGAGSYLTVSYVDVLQGRIPDALIEGRVVLVGATASGLMDHFATPFASHYPGVEVHATLVHNLMHRRFVRPATVWWGWGWAWLLALTVSLAVGFLRPPAAAGAATAALGLYVIVCFERFATGGVWAPLMSPLVCWTVGIATSGGYRYWTEERSKLAIKRAFGRYLAPDVVEEIAANPERLGLGGDERIVTIGFIDVRDFTTLSEKLTAGQLAHFLNDYLSVMTDTILAEGGTVDKYIGDAIMMLYGAPNPVEDHAQRACRTALLMSRAVPEHQDRWRSYGLPDVCIGVGLNTGVASVGNMGSSFRFDYTAMGDSVNLASRLEGVNKNYGTELIVGPETEALARNHFHFREIDFVRVKGKRDPVRIYELLESRDTLGEKPAFVEPFVNGLAAFRNRNWETARALFNEVLTLRPGDNPSLYYLADIDLMISQPPPPDWDGVSVMEHK